MTFLIPGFGISVTPEIASSYHFLRKTFALYFVRPRMISLTFSPPTWETEAADLWGSSTVRAT